MTYLFNDSSWTFEDIQRMSDACEELAINDFKLDYYPNQIEIVSSEQMLDAYASIGLPMMYNHWSFGKKFIESMYGYRKGLSGLAYELVINSSPCIAYCMEDNSALMQLLVIAHASFGHNSFFKSNYLFQEWTDAESIIDYLCFAKNYIAQCEEKYGLQEVEHLLDSAHTLANMGVDRYRKPAKLNIVKERQLQKERDEYHQRTLNDLWRTVPHAEKSQATIEQNNKLDMRRKSLGLPEENFLYFLEKKSPILKTWQREILRIVRKINQYFYPQRQTKIGNEGWATFIHYHMLSTLYERGKISEGQWLEFIHSHTNVIRQSNFDDPHYSGMNPYALGFAMFQDIKRMSENPTEEDKEWFPDVAGGDWLENCQYAMRNFRDESFISQYLSPKVMRDFKMFSVNDKSSDRHYSVTHIHNENGYKEVRRRLSHQNNISNLDPDMQIWDADLLGNRELVIRYMIHNGAPLADNTPKVLKHLIRLWGYNVKVIMVDAATGKEEAVERMTV